MTEQALIIFARNPIEGKVKTRLSKHLGTLETLKFYKQLLGITREATQNLPYNKYIFYDNFIDLKDDWKEEYFCKYLQSNSKNLGNKMKEAFAKIFLVGHTKVVIIGTDCPYLTTEIIEGAFDYLNDSEVVVGPAKDGGFYLLGVNSNDFLTFENITWSTNRVLKKYINNLETLTLNIKQIEILEDIDDFKSYTRYLTYKENIKL